MTEKHEIESKKMYSALMYVVERAPRSLQKALRATYDLESEYVRTPKECTAALCTEPRLARGYCQKHYARFKRNGFVVYEGMEDENDGMDDLKAVLDASQNVENQHKS